MKKGIVFLVALALSACTVQQFDGQRKTDPAAAARSRVAIAAEYIQKNQPELALQHLQRALEQDPKSPEAYNVMGVLLEKDDNFVEAEQNYKKALSFKAEYPQARNNYGVLLFRLKRYKEALEQFSLAANDLSYERRETSLEYVAKIALMLNDVNKAKASFERLLRLNNSLSEPALVLAQFAYDANNYAQAERYYQLYIRNIGKEAQAPQALLLGIRLAKQKKDNNQAASYELLLRKFYPQSVEYQQYLKEFETGT